MKIRQCNGLPDIHARLTPYLDTSSENMNSFPHFWFGSQCALHLSTSSKTGGVYLTAYLHTSSENMNSFPHFLFGSQCALHLKLDGVSDSLSEHFI